MSFENTVIVTSAISLYAIGWAMGGSPLRQMTLHALANGLGAYVMGFPALPLAFFFGYASSKDLKTMEVPCWIFPSGLISWLLTGGAVGRQKGILGFLAAFVFGLLLQRISYSRYGEVSFGGADVKLGCLFGLYGGLQVLLAGFFFGSVIGLMYAFSGILKGRIKFKDAIPFVPPLSTGFMGALLLSKTQGWL